MNLELTDNLGGVLSGTVFLPDGKTPAGKGITVSTKSNIGAELTVTTGANGKYEFAKILAPGRYDLFAHDPVSGRVAKETVFLQLEQDLVRSLRLLARGDVEVDVRVPRVVGPHAYPTTIPGRSGPHRRDAARVANSLY